MKDTLDKLNQLKEALETQTKILRGEEAELDKKLRSTRDKISHHEGRIFEVEEISNYLGELADADSSTGRDTGTAETGGQQQVD